MNFKKKKKAPPKKTKNEIIDKIYKEKGYWYLLLKTNNTKLEVVFNYFKQLQLERV